MPLLDHFHPPLKIERHWEGFHSTWASAICTSLNRDVLPEHYVAEPHVTLNVFAEADVATFEKEARLGEETGNGVATVVYAPPKARLRFALDWSDLDSFEAKVYREEGGLKLVAVVELVSPANKDRAATRKAFVRKCAGYLQAGVAVMVVDIVTSRSGNFHAGLLKLLGESVVAKPRGLYAASYRVVARSRKTTLEAWPAELRLGKPLPTLPLWIAPDHAVPVDLDTSYLSSCESLRISW